MALGRTPAPPHTRQTRDEIHHKDRRYELATGEYEWSPDIACYELGKRRMRLPGAPVSFPVQTSTTEAIKEDLGYLSLPMARVLRPPSSRPAPR